MFYILPPPFMSILFCLLSFFIILSSYPLYALLWWILLISTSSLFILSLGFGFLAFSYFILYIGAILILFLFVIMTLHNTFYFKSYTVWILASPFIIILVYAYGADVYITPNPPAPFLFDVLPSIAYPLFTFYSFLWYPCSLLLFLSLLFPIYLLL